MAEQNAMGGTNAAAAKRPPSGIVAGSESARADSDLAHYFEPLYSAEEMRAAEERYPAYPDSIPELMERAGAAVAREAMIAFPAAQSFACVCGGGSNGGDGRVAARILREAGHVADETAAPDGYDVVVDALFGTGFRGTPRPEAAELIAVAESGVLTVSPAGVLAGLPEEEQRKGRRGWREGSCPPGPGVARREEPRGPRPACCHLNDKLAVE